MLVLLALVFNAMQCGERTPADTIEREQWSVILKALNPVSIEEMDQLWGLHKRTSENAQEQYEIMQGVLKHAEAHACSQEEVNRYILLSWMLHVMILDKNCTFEPRASCSTTGATTVWYNLTCAEISVDSFLNFALPNSDDQYLVSLNNMSQVHLVSEKPTVQDRLFYLLQSVKLMYVDRSIKSLDLLMQSLDHQTVVTPLQRVPSCLWKRIIPETLKQFEGTEEYRYLSCGYFISLFLAHYDPHDKTLQCQSLRTFWNNLSHCENPRLINKRKQHPTLLDDQVDNDQQKQEDFERVLYLSGLPHQKLEYAFDLLGTMHPKVFVICDCTRCSEKGRLVSLSSCYEIIPMNDSKINV